MCRSLVTLQPFWSRSWFQQMCVMFWNTFKLWGGVWQGEILNNVVGIAKSLQMGSGSWSSLPGWIHQEPISNNTGLSLSLIQRTRCQRQQCVCVCARTCAQTTSAEWYPTSVAVKPGSNLALNISSTHIPEEISVISSTNIFCAWNLVNLTHCVTPEVCIYTCPVSCGVGWVSSIRLSRVSF